MAHLDHQVDTKAPPPFFSSKKATAKENALLVPRAFP